MRLLEFTSTGDVILTRDWSDDIVPPYAILSHTWGADEDEVIFEDLQKGAASPTSKPGYKKIQFSSERARLDGLKYLWLDTCCIDKSNSTVLQEAINSMFRWYQNAAKCYVYLTDVSAANENSKHMSLQPSWESEFRKSRWFTRGWTLQELLAPATVEFFSEEGEMLGDKRTLKRYISQITSIPVDALRDNSLTSFTIDERISWQASRETKKMEDKAYSLLGICGVHMPLIYGEGAENAFRRLREEIQKTAKGSQHEDFSVNFSLSNVPEIQQFVGREEELGEVYKALSGNISRRIVVLHGLGGIGKTQLAVEYTKRHKDSYSAVFWLNIKDKDSVKQSFAKIARQIIRDHPSCRYLRHVDMQNNLDEVVDAVKTWLSLRNNTRWLMIYDNYDNPRIPGNANPAAVDICEFLPDSYQGSIIITTRWSQIGIGYCIKVTKLEDVQDSLKILSDASRRHGVVNDPNAVRLAMELDGLPLALATAGAYLHQVGTSFIEYFRLYKASWAKLQKTSPGLSSYEYRTLHSTWQITFDHIEKNNQLSAKLLCLWAFFDNQDLWFELLQHSDSRDPEWLRELTEDELSFNAAVRVLCEHGLVETDSSTQEQFESKGYSMHPCVHQWTMNVLNQMPEHNLARLALKFVGLHVPDDDSPKKWLTERRLLPHATKCVDLVFAGMTEDNGLEWELHRLGILYMERRKLDEAEKIFERALHGYEKAVSPNQSAILDIFSHLGLIYADQGKLDQAEKMHMHAVQGYEELLGRDDQLTSGSKNKLGLVYMDQGKLEAAEKMFQTAIAGYQKALNAGATSAFCPMNNLGIVYMRQDKLQEAEKTFQRARQGYEMVLGPDHTSTFMTIGNLGITYRKLNKLDEAERMYELARQGYEKALGPDNVESLKVADNLYRLYASQGRLDDAESMYEQILQSYEKTPNLEIDSTNEALVGLRNIYCRRYLSLREESQSRDVINLEKSYRKIIVALIVLCERFHAIQFNFYYVFGRVLMLAKQDEDALIAFQHESRVFHPEAGQRSSTFCDGCGKPFTIGLKRFVCRACEYVDLCNECYKEYTVKELIPCEPVEDCQGHMFLAVPGTEKKNLGSGSDSQDTTLRQWLMALRVRYQTARMEL